MGRFKEIKKKLEALPEDYAYRVGAREGDLEELKTDPLFQAIVEGNADLMAMHRVPPKKLEKVFLALRHPNPIIREGAIALIMLLDKEIVGRFVREFEGLPWVTQDLAIFYMCATEYAFVYRFLFDLLVTTEREDLAGTILLCLGKTKYFFFPFVLCYLRDDHPKARERLKLLIEFMGLEKIGPYITLFPVIPYEPIFREIFGAEALKKLREPK